jgi:hypothetical protein
MPVFERSRDDGVRWTLEAWEPPLLRDLRDDLRTLLATGDPDDPAIARLHPAAVSGDDEADTELRDLIRDDLLAGRLAGLDALVDVLDRARPVRGGRVRVELVDDEPFLVLGVLNDVRLALGARVDVGSFDRDELDGGDPRVPTLALMDHLAFLQEALLAVLDPSALSHYDHHAPSAGDDPAHGHRAEED